MEDKDKTAGFDTLKAGDLLFMRDDSQMGSAIRTATGCYSHVGIFFDGILFHATRKKGVVKQELKSYLKENPHEVFVYRYPDINLEEAKETAEKYLGRPYNDSFYPNNGAFYCSQYVAEVVPIFGTVPMSFGDEKSKISEYWENYYEKLGLAVPLELEGTNPSQLASSEKLVFVGKLEQ